MIVISLETQGIGQCMRDGGSKEGPKAKGASNAADKAQRPYGPAAHIVRMQEQSGLIGLWST